MLDLRRSLPGVPFHRDECVIGHPADFRMRRLHCDRVQSHDLLSTLCSASTINHPKDRHQLPRICPGRVAVRKARGFRLIPISGQFHLRQVTLQSTGFWDQMWKEFTKSFPSAAPADEGCEAKCEFCPRLKNFHDKKEIMSRILTSGPILLSYDCLLQSSGWHVFRAQMYLALLMLPAALACNMLFCMMRILDKY